MLLEGLSTNSYHNLKNNVEQPVKLIFVLQYFWEYEENFHTKNICDTTCEDYTNIKFDGGDGCFGAVRDCEFKIRIHTTESQRLQVNIQIIFRLKTDGEKSFIEKSTNRSHLYWICSARRMVRSARKCEQCCYKSKIFIKGIIENLSFRIQEILSGLVGYLPCLSMHLRSVQ